MLRSSLRGALFSVACVAYAASARAQCEPTGPTLICPDSSITLCAPNAAGYRWTDTNGAQFSTSQCVTITAPGTYRIYTYDPSIDMWWACSHTVSLAPPESCLPPPPPPRIDPTPDTLSCPRPASWWTKQCLRQGNRSQLLDAEELEVVGNFVDERSELFSWEQSRAGFCQTLRHSDMGDLRARTHRQFAAVLANLCASGASMTRRDGRLFGLGEGAAFRTFFGTTTVGAWVDAADQELMQLRGARLKDKAVSAAYRRLFGEAWAIGHGVGLDTECPMAPSDMESEDSSVMAALGSDADTDSEMRIAAVAMPNPFHGSTRFAFTVPDASGAEVEMSVFDVAGRRMASLARGRFPVGSHVVQWDGRGLDGSRARAGMYFLRGRIGQVDVTTSVMKVE